MYLQNKRLHKLLYGKNSFATERAKNFGWIQIRKVILLNYQNKYVERSY